MVSSHTCREAFLCFLCLFVAQLLLTHLIDCCSGLRIISVANSAEPALVSCSCNFEMSTTPAELSLRRNSFMTSKVLPVLFDFNLPLVPTPNVSPSRGSRNVTSSMKPRARQNRTPSAT